MTAADNWILAAVLVAIGMVVADCHESTHRDNAVLKCIEYDESPEACAAAFRTEIPPMRAESVQ